MARTKQEIRNWLNAQVGQSLDANCGNLQGQCVSLIKALMNFLGAPNPYAARGNATDADNAYVAQGIGINGRGWLTICVNHNFAGGYGHIWVDLLNEANYEQNGAVALRVSKNTRPVTQAQQFVSFDKWVAPDPAPASTPNPAGLPAGFAYQPGVFTSSVTLNVRRGTPSTNAPVVAQYLPGQSVTTDYCGVANGYFWRSFVGASGNRNYIATANAARTEGYGTFRAN